MSTSDADDLALLTAIVESVTSDKFMAFIDKWLDNYTLLSGKGCVEWPEVATNTSASTNNNGNGNSNASPSSSSSSAGNSSSVTGFSVAHHAIHQNYQTIFESRLKSMLRTHEAALSNVFQSHDTNNASSASSASLEEKFYEICAKLIADKEAVSSSDVGSSPHRDRHQGPSLSKKIKAAAEEALHPSSSSSSASSGTVATACDVVDTLLDIVNTVGDFNAFAAMMSDRQREGLEDAEEE